MSIENNENIDSTNDESVELELDTNIEEESTTSEAPVEKPRESLEARKARLERQLEQTNKKLGVTVERKVENTSNSNDLGEKAYLIANGIKTADEIALAKTLSKETGKDIETLINTTYFQTELKGFREQKASDEATPKGNKRSNNTSVDSVEYWLAKGELPPASEVQLRRDVVNARMKKESSKGVFYNS